MRFAVFNFVDRGALVAFDQHFDRAVGQFEHLQNGGNTTHLEHVGDQGLVFGCRFLRHQHDAAVSFHGRFERLDALGATYKQRYHHVGKDHNVAQGQHRQIDRAGRQWGVTGHI